MLSLPKSSSYILMSMYFSSKFIISSLEEKFHSGSNVLAMVLDLNSWSLYLTFTYGSDFPILSVLTSWEALCTVSSNTPGENVDSSSVSFIESINLSFTSFLSAAASIEISFWDEVSFLESCIDSSLSDCFKFSWMYGSSFVFLDSIWSTCLESWLTSSILGWKLSNLSSFLILNDSNSLFFVGSCSVFFSGSLSSFSFSLV